MERIRKNLNLFFLTSRDQSPALPAISFACDVRGKKTALNVCASNRLIRRFTLHLIEIPRTWRWHGWCASCSAQVLLCCAFLSFFFSARTRRAASVPSHTPAKSGRALNGSMELEISNLSYILTYSKETYHHSIVVQQFCRVGDGLNRQNRNASII